MTIRNEIIEELNGFYERKGIVPSNFNCKNSDKCTEIALNSGNPICGKGAQAHVGHKYGEELRVVILSLDTGGSGYDNIEGRTETIEKGEFASRNKHMPGTIELLEMIFPSVPKSEFLKYFAMTNSAKCSGGTQDKLPQKVYENCSEFHKEEIEILDPQLIFVQGNDAYPDFLHPKPFSIDDLENFWKYINVDNLMIYRVINTVINKYLRRIIMKEDKVVPLIYGPHPSARYGRWETFRDHSLPLLNLYIQYIKQLN